MKFIAAASTTLLLASNACAFVPVSSPFGVVTSLNAKHANNKGAKKARHNRPKKSRLSDINRKPTVYPSFEKPSEYTISDAAPVLVTKKSE